MPQLTDNEIQDLREAGQKWVAIMQDIKARVQIGTNLLDIERTAVEGAKARGVIPSFKGFSGYPAATCLSVNDEIVHCIPKDYTLQNGDIITVDFGVYSKGLHVDGAVTWGVGDISVSAKQLLHGIYQALLSGTDAVRAGARVSDISRNVEKVLRGKGLAIYRQFVGHGIGHQLHQEPMIPNYVTGGPDPMLAVNTAIAIEPIAGLGADETVLDGDNGWDTRARSGQPVAEFEHTVLVTDTGYEVITPLETLIASTK